MQRRKHIDSGKPEKTLPGVPTGMNALGHPVPFKRQDKAYRTVQKMMPNIDKKTAYGIVSYCSEQIMRDKPFEIVGRVEPAHKGLARLDLTGRYRLLAELCTD